MRKIISLFMSGLLLLLLVGCTAGSGRGAGADDLPVLRVGAFVSRMGISTWYIVQNGLDIENGFRIELSEFSGGGVPVNEALGAGLLDVAHIGSPAAVTSASVFGAKIIAATSSGSIISLFARPDSEIVQAGNTVDEFPNLIGSAESLRGAEFLFPFGTMSQIAVARYVDALGLGIDDVVSLNMQHSSAYQAFRAGEGDIVATYTPNCFTALDEGFVRVATLHYLDVPMYGVLIANSNTYDEKRETIGKFLALTFEVNDMLSADMDYQALQMQELNRINGVDVSLEDIRNEMEILYLVTGEKARTLDHGISVVETAKFYVKIGILEEDRMDTVRNSIDTRLLKEVLN